MTEAGVQSVIENADDDYIAPSHDIAMAYDVRTIRERGDGDRREGERR